MTCWVVIPAKGPDQGKRRLAGVLDEAARRKLARAMLEKVIAAAQAAVTTERTFILGPAQDSLDLPVLSDPGGGLNTALTAALAEVRHGGASRVVFIAGDLPRLTGRDVELLALAPEGAIAIAPDRHGTGTNAVSLPIPAAGGFTFSFGPGSFAQHSEETRRIGLALEIVESPGLMRDIDVPEDLGDAADLLGD